MIVPLRRCTSRDGDAEESMVTRQTLATAASDRMFAMESGLK
jgi:hypothetical protein